MIIPSLMIFLNKIVIPEQNFPTRFPLFYIFEIFEGGEMEFKSSFMEKISKDGQETSSFISK